MNANEFEKLKPGRTYLVSHKYHSTALIYTVTILDVTTTAYHFKLENGNTEWQLFQVFHDNERIIEDITKSPDVNPDVPKTIEEDYDYISLSEMSLLKKCFNDSREMNPWTWNDDGVVFKYDNFHDWFTLNKDIKIKI